MSVKVVRERSDQRRHHRVTAPLFVEYAGHRHKATDWSLGGVRLDGFPGPLPEPGTTIALHVSIPFQGFEVAFDCQAEVVRRIEQSGTFAVKFTQIGERELGLMEHFIDELIRGSMSDVKDTIQRIDVPVTPASTKPDVNPLTKIPIGRWPTKTLAMVAFYLTIGLFVFGYAGVIAYTNFVRMEVDTAVIASPVESVRSQVNGRIAYGRYRQGDHVPKGALLLGVTDNDLERQIDLATIDIKDKSAQLASFERMLTEELSRVDAFARVEGKNVEQIALELQSLEAQAKAAEALFQRLDHLFKQGFTTATLTENAEKQMIAAQKLTEAKRVELQTRQSLATYNAGERLYNGQSFFGERAKTESQTFLAREQVAIAERKLQALLDHRDRLAVYAPYDGMLQELPRPDGSMVRLGDTIAVVEDPLAREIWAFLRQDEVLSVGLGDDVKVYLPGLSELRKAKVKRIDRTIGFVNEMNSTYIWRAPRDRSAKVVLEFADAGSNPQDESYRTGMPAVAIFATRPTNYLIGDMMHRFRMVFGGRQRKPVAPATTPDPGSKPGEGGANGVPVAARPERSGPPRNYEAARDPIHDPDAVTARRAFAQANAPAPAKPTGPATPTLAPPPSPASLPANEADKAIDGIAGLRDRLRVLLQKPQSTEMASRAVDTSGPAAPPKPTTPPVQPVEAVDRTRDQGSPPEPRPMERRVDQPAAAAVAEQKPATKKTSGETEVAVSRQTRPSPMPPQPAPMTESRQQGEHASIGTRTPAVDQAKPEDDEREAEDERTETATPRPAGVRGLLTRMADRLRALFTLKPADDDEDWGTIEDVAGDDAVPARPESRRVPAVPSATTPSRDEGPARRFEPGPSLPAPAPTPAKPPRPHRQTASIADNAAARPVWQDRLRRTRSAEHAP